MSKKFNNSFILFFFSFLLIVPFSYSSQETIKEYWPTGELKSEEPVVNGRREGLAHYWWANGREYGKIPWKNGEKHGSFSLYREDGTLEMELSYENGKLHGLQKWYDVKGQIMDQAEYQNNLLHGRRIKYKPDGSIEYEANYAFGNFQNYAKTDEVRTTETPKQNFEKVKYQIWYKKPSSKISSSGQSFWLTIIVNALIFLSIGWVLSRIFRRKN